MADAIISAVASRVTAIVADQIRYEVNLARGVEEKVRSLSEKLEMLRDVLDDAEKKGWKERSVRKWLKKLEDAAYTMDDILDGWSYALRKHKFEKAAMKRKVSFFPNPCLWLNQVDVSRDTSVQIQKAKARIDEISEEKDFLNLVTSPAPASSVVEPLRAQTTSLIEVEKVVDREDIKNDIVGRLCHCQCGDTDNQIVAIVGMGGIGKTTLAQLVCNDSRVKDCFGASVYWICVSSPFDLVAIARGILDRVGGESISPNCNDWDLALQKLGEAISGKKFLLVLDDVWTEKEEEWAPLKISLKRGARTSKILVTTRNEGVARMMGTLEKDICRPRQLNDEECWSLLRRMSLSGRSDDECVKFEQVGKKIAAKCKGLPLAAIVLGSLLRFKNNLEEWEHVSKSEIWKLEKAELDLFPHLLLSYNELPTRVKRCFSYCAIYPKDSQIDVDTLIEEWMAMGYLSSDAGNRGVKHTGREYFNRLASCYLFQDFNRRGEEITSCKMHDIVHDFAQSLRKNNEAAETTKRSCPVCDPVLVSQAREYRSSFWIKESLVSICDCLKSLRVFRFKVDSLRDCPPPRGLKKLIHLRWLDLNHHKLSDEDLKIICRLYFLQVLILSDCSMEKIPREIENLVDLRLLDLSGNGELLELPESMGSLHDLQNLNIHRCKYLHPLPEWIGMLKNLQHIRCHHGDLDEFQVRSGFNKLGLLKHLNNLCGDHTLKIRLDSVSDLEELAEDAAEAELRNKTHIRSLSIKFHVWGEWWSSLPSSSTLWMDVIEALEPSRNLRKLTINGYRGCMLPHWMLSLKAIKYINLKFMPAMQSLAPIGKLPFLEVLHMEKMMQLKSVGREFLGIESPSTSHDVVVAFPKLETLIFDSCP